MAKQSRYPVTIALPIRGVDVSMPAHQQPELTCRDARNVRVRTAEDGSMYLTPREGLERLFTAAAGSAVPTGRRVNAVVPVPRTIVLPPEVNGTKQAINDDLTGYPAGGNGAWLYSADFRGAYTIFRKPESGTGLAWVLGPKTGDFRVGLAYNQFAASSPICKLFCATGNVIADGATGVAIAYPTTNEIEVDLWADSEVLGNMFQAFGVDGIGPFVRGSGDLRSFITCYFEWTGQANVVRLAIDKHENGAVTRLATSQREFQLRGLFGATQQSTCTMKLTATGTQVVATVNWPDGAAGGVIETLSIDNTDLASQNRGGVTLRTNAGSGAEPGRSFRRIAYTRLLPYAYKVAPNGELRAALVPNQASPNVWFLPPNISSSTHAAGIANIPVKTDGGVSGVSYAAAQNFTTANTATEQLTAAAGLGNARDTRTQVIAPTATPAGILAVDVFHRDISAGVDTVNPVFRLTDDHRFMIRIELERQIDATMVQHKQSGLTKIEVAGIWNNGGTRTRTSLGSFTFTSGGSLGQPIFNINTPVRFTHTGTVIKALVNGVEMFSYDYSTSGSWAAVSAGIGAGTNAGVDVGSQGLGDAAAAGYRIVDLTPPPITPVTEGIDLVVVTPGTAQVGQLENLPAGLAAVTAEGSASPADAEIVWTLLFNKVYMVDGTSTLVIDPIKRTIKPLVASRGVVPASGACRVAATFRGRLVLGGAQENRPGGFLSAVGQPDNFDLGFGSEATRARSFTAADAGQPSEGIRALIPFSDDYMLIGCDTSIWVLEGDPGAGGVVQNVSYQTGIIGPRAFCFSETGVMFFLGSGGLCVMKGTRVYEPVGSRRLGGLIDRMNINATRIMMVYDPVCQAVHIFLTPKNGDRGTHAVYLVSEDAFWLDELPAGFDPLCVAQLPGSSLKDRRYVMGSADGYLRRPSEVFSDDGEAMTAYLRFPPIEIGDGMSRAMAREIQATLGASSGPVDWAWITADSCESIGSVSTAEARISGEWSGSGYQEPVGMREGGAAHQLVVGRTSSEGRYRIARLVAMFEPLGRRLKGE